MTYECHFWNLQPCSSYFGTCRYLIKCFSHDKRNGTWLLLIKMVNTSWLTSCQTTNDLRRSKNPKIFVITSTNKNKKFIWKFLISRVVNKGREGLIPLLLHFIPMFLDHHEGFTAGLQFFWHQQNIYQYHKSNLEISNENATTSTPLCSTQVA